MLCGHSVTVEGLQFVCSVQHLSSDIRWIVSDNRVASGECGSHTSTVEEVQRTLYEGRLPRVLYITIGCTLGNNLKSANPWVSSTKCLLFGHLSVEHLHLLQHSAIIVCYNRQ